MKKRSKAVSKKSPQQDLLDFLAATDTFSGVDREALATLIASAEVRELAPGDYLYRPHQSFAHRVFILLSGRIELRLADGGVDDIPTGEIIGLSNYLDGEPHSSGAIAVAPSRVLAVEDKVMDALEESHQSFFVAVNRVIAKKLRRRVGDRAVSKGTLALPVAAVMKSPVASCDSKFTLRQVFERMRERRIGSVVVTDKDEGLLGVVTCSGLSEAVILNGAKADESVLKAACEKAWTIHPDTSLWKAEEIQQRYGVKYLIVVEHDKPVGMVSQTDILRAVIAQPGQSESRIADAQSIEELGAWFKRLPELAGNARETHRLPSAAVRELSENHLAIQRRCVELTLRRLEEEGKGAPPSDFALLIMGSGGRREMLLDPDQDNGIIIADDDGDETEEKDAWFTYFSEQYNLELERIGYPLCPGEIMARNRKFRKSLSRWKKQIAKIVDSPTAKAARWAQIVFDFDTLYGDDTLTLELRRHLLECLSGKPRLLHLMAADDAEGKPAIGLFNRLVSTTRGEHGDRIDIKRNGLRIIADAARIFGLQKGVAVQNTVDRLTTLVRVGTLSDDFSRVMREAFEELLDLAISHQIQQVRLAQPLDKMVDPGVLTPQAHSGLRMAMRAAKRLQDRLQDEFEVEIF